MHFTDMPLIICTLDVKTKKHKEASKLNVRKVTIKVFLEKKIYFQRQDIIAYNFPSRWGPLFSKITMCGETNCGEKNANSQRLIWPFLTKISIDLL